MIASYTWYTHMRVSILELRLITISVATKYHSLACTGSSSLANPESLHESDDNPHLNGVLNTFTLSRPNLNLLDWHREQQS
jgi:hypothetical protein